MYKILSAIFALLVVSSDADSAPFALDERDVIRSAHVFHIMGPSQDSLVPLRAQLNGISGNRLLSEFRRLARDKSSDVGSASDGGDLGHIVEGTMDEQFEAAIFAQQPMRVSSPQWSAFGWHLILVVSTTRESVRDICVRSFKEAQEAAPIVPAALFQFSIERQSRESLHPTILQFIGDGWGPPMNWKNNLMYWRDEPSPEPGMARLVLHSEMPYAVYGFPPSGCQRSERDVFQVDCAARTVALISHVSYEGRGAAGRRLNEVEYGPDKRKVEPARTGFLAQVADQACTGAASLTPRPILERTRAKSRAKTWFQVGVHSNLTEGLNGGHAKPAVDTIDPPADHASSAYERAQRNPM